MSVLDAVARLPDFPTVQQVASALGMPEQRIRVQIRRGIVPYGIATKSNQNYCYTIYKGRLLAFLSGEDMKWEARKTIVSE